MISYRTLLLGSVIAGGLYVGYDAWASEFKCCPANAIALCGDECCDHECNNNKCCKSGDYSKDCCAYNGGNWTNGVCCSSSSDGYTMSGQVNPSCCKSGYKMCGNVCVSKSDCCADADCTSTSYCGKCNQQTHQCEYTDPNVYSWTEDKSAARVCCAQLGGYTCRADNSGTETCLLSGNKCCSSERTNDEWFDSCYECNGSTHKWQVRSGHSFCSDNGGYCYSPSGGHCCDAGSKPDCTSEGTDCSVSCSNGSWTVCNHYFTRPTPEDPRHCESTADGGTSIPSIA